MHASSNCRCCCGHAAQLPGHEPALQIDQTILKPCSMVEAGWMPAPTQTPSERERRWAGVTLESLSSCSGSGVGFCGLTIAKASSCRWSRFHPDQEQHQSAGGPLVVRLRRSMKIGPNGKYGSFPIEDFVKKIFTIFIPTPSCSRQTQYQINNHWLTAWIDLRNH